MTGESSCVEEMAKVPEVVLTPRIREALDSVINSDTISLKDKIEFRNVLSECNDDASSLTFKTVRNLANILSASGQKVYLHDLLKGSDLHLASVEPPKRNEELEARLTKLRAEAANKEYDQMVGNVVKKTDPLNFSIGEDVKAINRQMTAVFNFIITVVAAFVFGYKGSDLLLGVSNVAEKLAYGLFLGTVVFFADLYFLVKHTK